MIKKVGYYNHGVGIYDAFDRDITILNDTKFVITGCYMHTFFETLNECLDDLIQSNNKRIDELKKKNEEYENMKTKEVSND